MFIDRRKFVTLAAATLAAPSALAATRPIKAIAFDGFVITDPRPVFAKTEDQFPDKGRALIEARRIGLARCRARAEGVEGGRHPHGVARQPVRIDARCGDDEFRARWFVRAASVDRPGAG